MFVESLDNLLFKSSGIFFCGFCWTGLKILLKIICFIANIFPVGKLPSIVLRVSLDVSGSSAVP